MATDINKATLVGSASTMSLLSDGDILDTQEFSFPGLNESFKTSLGFKGRIAIFGGLLRFSGANVAAARANLQTQLTAIRNYQQLGTELDLFQNADTSSIASLYTGSFESVVIEGFQLLDKASKTTLPDTSVVITQPYRLIVRKLN